MKHKKVAVYAGSFDPLTNGHMWVIQQGLALFDEIVVAVGTNPDKKSTFTLEERLEMLQETLKDIPHATIASAGDQLLVRYAQSRGAKYTLRGIRSQRDYEFESGMWGINHGIDPEITTFFLIPPPEITHVSSSMVKELARYKEWDEVGKYVPAPVLDRLKKKFG